jgi:predicted nucleotidyltransferase
MPPTQEQLTELVRRIVAAVNPLRIILFGSAARGEMRGDSDLDVLVVMPEGTHRRHTAQSLYPRLVGLNIAVDILVATPADLERYGDMPGFVYHDVLREGKELYAA